MSRRNIFELLEKEIEFSKEVKRIDELFSKQRIMARDKQGDLDYFTLEKYINEHYFLQWKHRRRCLSIEELLREIIIYPIDLIVNLEDFLTYCEFVSNMLLVLYLKALINDDYTDDIKDLYLSLIENVDSCLSELNMKRTINIDDEVCLITEINPAATMAADKLGNSKKAFRVFEYNHYLAKGNLTRKREILKVLAEEFEPLRNVLNSNGYKDLSDRTGFLLNNMNIRHNNLEGKNANPLLETISPKGLEEIYDKTYECLLLCINTCTYIGQKDYLDELKKKRSE